MDGGHPTTANADVSGSDWWKDYIDYFSNDFDASFAATGGGETQSESATFGVDMMTRVTGVTKAYPRPESEGNYVDPPNNYYFNWQDAWGPKPDNADDYFYIAWVVDYGRSSSNKTTQPFKIDLKYYGDENKFTVGGQEFSPEWLGCGKSPDGMVGLANHPETYYANTWDGIVDRDVRTGRPASSKYNDLGYTASNTGFAWYGARGGNDPTFTVLMAYPNSVIDAARAAGIDLEEEGVDIGAKFRFKETWDSGYVKDYLVEASPVNIVLHSVEPGSGFVKVNGHMAYRLNGFQTYLSNGSHVDLRFTTEENGTYNGSWYLEYAGTAKSEGRASLASM